MRESKKSSQRSEQEKLLKLLDEQKARRARNPLRYLKPHAKQLRALDSDARIVLVIGGNQIGKTTGGWIWAIANAYGYRFWEHPDLELRSDGRGGCDLPHRDTVPSKLWIRNGRGDPIAVPNVGFVVTGLAARRGIGDTLYPKLLEMWPPSAKLKVRYMMGGVPASIRFPNGSTIVHGSGEQTQLSTEGIVLNWAWADEPIPQRIYSGLWRGLLRNFGRMLFTLTPLGGTAAWIYNDLILGRGKQDVSVDHIQVGMTDNPYLDPDAIRQFQLDPTFSDAERQARIHGKFEHISSRVWPAFHDGEPYTCAPIELPRDWPRLCILDPHSARPWALIWVALAHDGRAYVYREWPEQTYVKLHSSDKTIKDYASLIRDLEGKEPVRWRVIDPNYGIQRRRHLGFVQRSIQEELSDYGLHFDAMVDDNLERGFAVVGDMFNYDKSRALSPDNGPKIVIFDHCTNTIRALTNFAYIESSVAHRRSERVSEEFKDFADLIRYYAVYERPSLDDSFSYLQGDDDDE